MPPEVAKVLVVIPSSAAVVYHLVETFRKSLSGASGDDAGGRLPCHPLAVIAAVLLALLLTACATVKSKTTITAPDGTVTVTESESSAPDAGSVKALAGTAAAFAPRAVVIDASGK